MSEYKMGKGAAAFLAAAAMVGIGVWIGQQGTADPTMQTVERVSVQYKPAKTTVTRTDKLVIPTIVTSTAWETETRVYEEVETETVQVTETVAQTIITTAGTGSDEPECDVTGDAVAAAWELFDTGDFTRELAPYLGQEDSAMVDEILWQREQIENGGAFDMKGLLCAHPEWVDIAADDLGVER